MNLSLHVNVKFRFLKVTIGTLDKTVELPSAVSLALATQNVKPTTLFNSNGVLIQLV